MDFRKKGIFDNFTPFEKGVRHYLLNNVLIIVRILFMLGVGMERSTAILRKTE